jgi:hypothetical protein
MREPEGERLPVLSQRALADALTLARELRWTELALIGKAEWSSWQTYTKALVRGGWPASRILVVDEISAEQALDIASIGTLRSLAIRGAGLGAEGARALASLTGLTTLDLSGNGIGDEGARALASLTGLTTLDLSGNGIGDEGARALASLTGLTTLHLSGNGIGDEDARALESLTSLDDCDLPISPLSNSSDSMAVSTVTNDEQPTTQWLRERKEWLTLLRGIGMGLAAYAIAYAAFRLQTSSETWSNAIVLRWMLLLVGGVGLVVGRSESRWFAIAGLGMNTVAMAGHVLTHLDAWALVVLLAKVTTLVVLLHPGARIALDPEAKEASVPPPMWVRVAMWVCIPLLMAGPVEALLEMGLPVMP